MSKWFTKEVLKKKALGGWKKTQPAKVRRANALKSKPKNLTLHNRRLSAGRSLLALSNATSDKTVEILARRDAHYFFKLLLKK